MIWYWVCDVLADVVKNGSTIVRTGTDVSTIVEKQLRDILMAVENCFPKRCLLVTAFGVDAGALVDQGFDKFDAAVLCGLVQQRFVVHTLAVRIDSTFDQLRCS